GAAAYRTVEVQPVEESSDYYYEHAVVGPGGGAALEQGASEVVAGSLGMATSVSRRVAQTAPDWATYEYSERRGSVVGPLGGTRAGSASYFHAETADRGLTYSRYTSSRSTVGPVGPVGGVAIGRTTAAAVGPFGAAG